MTTDKTKRTPCQVFSRCMWYIRPVEYYNIGKKSEFYGRKWFTEEKVNNSEFLKKYLPSKQ